MALTMKYQWINSQGDISDHVFDTVLDATTWLAINAEAGHKYYLVNYYTST